MAFSYSIHPRHGLLWNRLHGAVTATDLTDLVSAFRTDPAYRPDLRILDDLRGMTHDRTGYQSVWAIAEENLAFRAANPVRVRLAFLAPDDPGYGMAGMYAALMSECEGLEIGVFRDLAAAAGHLDLDAEARALVEAWAPDRGTLDPA